MSEAKHTPGPWRVDGGRSGKNSDRLMIVHGDDNERYPIIAEVLPDFTRFSRDDNARLIAAAPETAAERDRLKESLINAAGSMDEALSEALQFIPEGSVVPAWIVRLEFAAKDVRAAILKVSSNV